MCVCGKAQYVAFFGPRYHRMQLIYVFFAPARESKRISFVKTHLSSLMEANEQLHIFERAFVSDKHCGLQDQTK